MCSSLNNPKMKTIILNVFYHAMKIKRFAIKYVCVFPFHFIYQSIVWKTKHKNMLKVLILFSQNVTCLKMIETYISLCSRKKTFHTFLLLLKSYKKNLSKIQFQFFFLWYNFLIYLENNRLKNEENEKKK